MKTPYLVNVFCVGAQKAGTTTLFELLVQHPDVCEPQFKENHFFNDPDYLKKFNQYIKETNGISEALFHIDFTPGYLAHPLVAERIKAYNPQAKIVILLRQPAQRAYSHYKMSKRNGLETRDFDTCVNEEITQLKQGLNLNNYKGYVARGLYSVQLERYYAQFDSDQIRVYLFEDFIRNQQTTIDDLLNFIGAKAMTTEPLRSNAEFAPRFAWLWRIYNKIPYKYRKVIQSSAFLGNLKRLNRKPTVEEHPNPETMRLLNDYYQSDIIKLEQLLHRDLSAYKQIKLK
jgi:hypothetical protein